MKVNSKIWYDVSCAHKIKLIQSKQSNTQTRKTQTISSSYNITFYYITTSNMKFIQLLTIASLAIFTNAPQACLQPKISTKEAQVLRVKKHNPTYSTVACKHTYIPTISRDILIRVTNI